MRNDNRTKQERSMNIGNGMMKQLTKLGLLLMMGVSMSACSETMSWKEEVLLHDGQIIVVERFYNLGGKPTLESRERAALDETVTFSLPGTNKKIIWKTDFRDSQPEQNSLNLLLLDIVKGVPYIATYPAGCIAYNKWKRPNPPYILFKYEGNEWKRISLAEFPAELVKTNVIVGRPPTDLLKSHYTVEQVNERNYYLENEHKTILRKPVKDWVGCPELVRVEGGWVSPGGAKAPIPITPRNSSDVKK
jgi:hypothetical protein